MSESYLEKILKANGIDPSQLEGKPLHKNPANDTMEQKLKADLNPTSGEVERARIDAVVSRASVGGRIQRNRG